MFAAVSTSDFMQHLDRQVHSVHCSFIPGAGKEIGDSGCKTVMMSPYSSFFRESVWGGIPVSLWALATFAFLAYRAGLLLWRGKPSKPQTLFLLAATALPVLMTVIYAFLSVAKVGSTCKICVGIYVSSAIVFIGALIAHQKNTAPPEQGRFPLWFAEGVGFVVVLTLTYLLFTPTADQKTSLTGCGLSGKSTSRDARPICCTDRSSWALRATSPTSCTQYNGGIRARHVGSPKTATPAAYSALAWSASTPAKPQKSRYRGRAAAADSTQPAQRAFS